MEYDVIVVGGGTTGGIIAARLSEDSSRSVLLLEAGADYTSGADVPEALRAHPERGVDDTDYLWSFDLRLTESRDAGLRAGRLLGGGGAVNNCLFLRGIPDDYDSWGSRLWSWDSVLPFFKRSETDLDYRGPLHGDDGPIPVWRYPRDRWHAYANAFYHACLTLGFDEKDDLNDPEGSGVGALPHNDPGGQRMSTAMTYLRTARERENLTIRPSHLCSKVLLEAMTAVGVEAIVDNRTVTFGGGEIVLTAGNLASPQLLMLSGIGGSDQLSSLGIQLLHHLPAVGRNITDHAALGIALGAAEGAPVPARDGIRQVGCVYTTDGSDFEKDVHLVAALDQINGRYMVECWFEHLAMRGSIHLASVDPRARVRVDYRHLSVESDRRRAREGVRKAFEIATSTSLQHVSTGPIELSRQVVQSDDRLDAWVGANLMSAMHGCGSCTMGSDPQTSVVDERCRVHGIDRLRIADLSIVPYVVRAPSNATAVMVGERAADLIEEDIASKGKSSKRS